MLLLFGSAAVALSLMLMPDSERRSLQARNDYSGIDHMLTGSIGGGNVTPVQRGIFQTSLDTECIISRDGTKRGRC